MLTLFAIAAMNIKLKNETGGILKLEGSEIGSYPGNFSWHRKPPQELAPGEKILVVEHHQTEFAEDQVMFARLKSSNKISNPMIYNENQTPQVLSL